MPKNKPSRKQYKAPKNMPSTRSIFSNQQAETLLNKGIKFFQAGDLAQAEIIFRNIALNNPDIPNVWNLLGITSLTSGQPQNAIVQINKAITVDNSIPDFHYNLALAYIETADNGNAIQSLEAALKLRPDYIEALNTLASIYITFEQWEQAKIALEQAVSIDPEYAEAWINMCGVLQELDFPKEAVKAGERSIRLLPNHTQAIYNLARAYGRLEIWDLAIELYERCIELGPDFIKGYINKGWSHINIQQFSEAETILTKAAEISPDNSEVLDNLALSLSSQGKYDEAIPVYKRSLELAPDNPETHHNFSHVLLAGENFSDGWKEYDYGLKTTARGPIRPSVIPEWNGEPLDGKLIYVLGEQGVGEEIMFSSMIPDLLSQGASVIYECDDRLIPLFKRAMPELMTTPRAQPQHIQDIINSNRQADFRIPVGSLGRFLRTSSDQFKPSKILLQADPNLTEKYRRKYKSLGTGPVIGISWKSQSPSFQVKKSFLLDLWKPILSLPNLNFVSLQYGDVDEDVTWARKKFRVDIYTDPDVSALKSIDESAAQISAVDLVVSISNATVHIAGACNINTWAILDDITMWHWFLDRQESLWYSSVQLFRKNAELSQHDLINAIAEKLSSKFKYA